MKTLLKLLGITVLVTVIGFAISCGGGGGGGGGITPPPGGNPYDPHGGDTECVHNWSGWSTYISPDGAEVGKPAAMTEKRTCSICGETETRNTTTFTPTVIINLTSGSVTGTANTASAPNITITPAASDVVLIIGDGSTGRDITINNAQEIYIADNTVFKNNTGVALLAVAGDVVITGGGSVSFLLGAAAPSIIGTGNLTISGTIGGIESNSYCINGSGNITITGAIGNITNTMAPAINTFGNITITGATGDITGANGCIQVSGNINISGTIGDITSTLSSAGLSAGGDILISGRTGSIKGKDNNGIRSSSSGSITISGITGAIKGDDNSGGAGYPGIEIVGAGSIAITGTVEDIRGGLGDIPANNGAQIKIDGVEYGGWPSVKSWP